MREQAALTPLVAAPAIRATGLAHAAGHGDSRTDLLPHDTAGYRDGYEFDLARRARAKLTTAVEAPAVAGPTGRDAASAPDSELK